MLFKVYTKEEKLFYMVLNKDLLVFLCSPFKMLKRMGHLGSSKEPL
jgi:hypothetical protein